MAIRYEYWASRMMAGGTSLAVRAREEVLGPLVLLDVAGVRVDRRSKADTVLDGSLGNDP